jgi:hypothetical protein
MNWKGFGRNRSGKIEVLFFCWEELRKNKKKFCQNNQYPNGNSNRAPPEPEELKFWQ